jgi:hypothetical protein
MWHSWKLELAEQLAEVGGFDEWVRGCIGRGNDDDDVAANQPDSGVLVDGDESI